MSDHDRFAELWTDYLEGELDDRGVAELRELLTVDESLVERAADLFQTHRLLGLVVAEKSSCQDEFLRQTMSCLPVNHDAFVNRVMSNVVSTQEKASGASKPPVSVSSSTTQPGKRRSSIPAWVWVAGSVMLASVVFLFSWPKGQPISPEQPDRAAKASENVRLASVSHAKFFGEFSPPVGSVLIPKREYVLVSGLVEVAFPAGASAILEGPAVFRVTSAESLALDVGRCSVYAPDGAEGFRVETPVTRVVDRGTRFSVNVAETSETEVQVIEGAADIYGNSGNKGLRLGNGEARKFASTGAVVSDAIPFNAGIYRRGLPDRVVSYEASTAADGGLENLLSVTVQRGGKVMKVPVEDLIPSRVTWFKSTTRNAFLCGDSTLPSPRTDVSSDHSLITGIINPDGSKEPLTTSPVMEGESGTPGLAIRFDRPVTNGPGADVVFFDLQTIVNPPDGDAFHVSPLTFRDGLRSHTIRKYDLTMESPEARELKNFYVHFVTEPADSLDKLESLACSPRKQAIRFRGLAVGIDLSDLGYAEGETVEGLFFQDVLDDQHYVDPVFIGGLPEMK